MGGGGCKGEEKYIKCKISLLLSFSPPRGKGFKEAVNCKGPFTHEVNSNCHALWCRSQSSLLNILSHLENLKKMHHFHYGLMCVPSHGCWDCLQLTPSMAFEFDSKYVLILNLHFVRSLISNLWLEF